MKKSIVLFLASTSLLLSSCAFFNVYSTEAKELNVYEIDQLVKDNNKDLEKDGKKGTISPLFIKGEKYIPYVSLKQYAELYTPYFDENAKSVVNSDTTGATWTVYVNDELYFYAVISPYTKSVFSAGNLSNTFKSESNPNDYSSMTYRTKFEDSYERIGGENNYGTYSFRNSSFKSFRKDGEYYFPLGLFDVSFSESSNIYFTYNYKAIYATWDASNYSEPFYSGGIKTSVDQEMEAMTVGETIPSYLVNYNANLFIFTMENFYGLKSTYGISSIRDFYIKNNLYDGLFSADGAKRGDTYSRALAIFDDNHTGLVSVNNAWGEGATKSYGGDGVIKRQKLKQTLSKMRKDYYEGKDTVVYSQNNKTAMLIFDEFSYGSSEEVFDDQGNISENAYQYDTFYYVLRYLKEIKNHNNGSVKNVVLDISLNGGGAVVVMAKLLALISKDNKGPLSMYAENTGIVSTTIVSIDTNNDDEYDGEDCFGNDFDFYILSSDCAFSCGNAFPCYAQLANAKVIGEKSGGGECAVAIHYMPNSEYVYHSSMTHLGSFEQVGQRFNGFEGGAKPDISLVKNGKTALLEYQGNELVSNIPDDFYDIDTLDNLIEQAKTK